MLGYKQCEIGIFGLFGRIFVAVSVYGHDAVCIFTYHDAIWIHAERTHIVLELFCAVNNLALVKLIGQMGKDHSRKLHTDT